MTRAGRILSLVLVTVLAVVAGSLCVISVTSTVWLSLDKNGELTQNMHIFTLAAPSSWPVLLGGFAGLVLVLALLRWAWAHATALDSPHALAVLVVVVTVAQVAWVLLQQTTKSYWGDSWMINAFVEQVEEGGWSVLATDSAQNMDHNALLYFACYPFQSWWFFWCLGLRGLFGDASLMAMQLFNVAANALTVVCLVRIGRLVLSTAPARRVLMVLVALCLPLYWLCSYLYGNAVGMAFGMLFLWLQARALCAEGRRERLRLIALSTLPLVACLCFKATFILFALGALVCWVLVSLMRRNGWPLLALVVVLLVANAAADVPSLVFGQLTGIDTSGGMTTLNHLELGLRDDMNEFSTTYDEQPATVSPGGWSRHSSNVWELTDGDASAQNASALASIAEDLDRFTSDPGYALWFFGTKLTSEWCDPTFQSLYYASMCGQEDGDRFNPVDTTTTLGMACEGLTFVLDGYQTLVYLGSFGGLALMVRRRTLEGASLLLPCTFFAGFGCYLLWEEKSVYTFPFFLVLLPLAAAGLSAIFTKVRGGRGGTLREVEE